MFKTSGTALFLEKERLRHDHSWNKALANRILQKYTSMAPNEKVGVSAKVEFALENHSHSSAVDQNLVTRKSKYDDFLHGGSV